MRKLLFHSLFLFAAFVLIGSCSDKRTVADNRFVTEGYAAQTTADSFLRLDRQVEAFRNYSKARQLYERASDSARIIYVLLNMADLYYLSGDFHEAQATAVEAKQFLSERTKEYRPSVFNTIGRTFAQLEEYSQAIDYYKKTISSTSNLYDVQTATNNIADVYINEGKFDSAIRILDSLNRSSQLQDAILKARVMDNLGFARAKSGDRSGWELMWNALSIRSKSEEEYDCVTSMLHLAESYNGVNKDSSVFYARRAVELSRKIGAASERKLGLGQLAIQADDAKAVNEFVLLIDSIQLANRKKRNQFANIKYDYKAERESRLKSELKQLEAEKEAISWTAGFAGLTVLSALVIAQIIRRGRRNRWKAIQQTQERISHRLHDEVANNLHKTMVYAETTDLSNPSAVEGLLGQLDGIYRDARSLSRENASISDPMQYSVRLRELIKSYDANRHIVVQGFDTIDWTNVAAPTRISVYHCVQELLVNMKKHSNSTHVLFRFSKTANRGVLEYSDNGQGAPSMQTTNGLSIMENRIKSIKGTFTFGVEPGKGFRARIEFPL